MSEGAPFEVNCGNCNAACCRAGTVLVMGSREAHANRFDMKLTRVAKGTKTQSRAFSIQQAKLDAATGQIVPVWEVMTIPADHGLYHMTEDCGHLTDDDQCGIYTDRKRPIACAKYEVGSAACLAARTEAEAPTEATAPGFDLREGLEPEITE